MIKTGFIYFPSFSAGEMGSNFVKDHRFRNDMTIRFYSEEYPKEFQHNQLLITAGAHMSVQDYKNKMGLTDRNLVMGDSGGFQFASGALKWDIKYRDKIFNWLSVNTDVAMNLDLPPRLKNEGKFQECLDISLDNFKYFQEKQDGSTKFLNVVQGDDEHTYKHWYNQVKDFDFNGWGIGGAGGSLYRFMSGVYALLQGKEHLNPRNEYFHILGTSKIRDFLMLIQLQKSLEDIGSKIVVTTDSSSPDRAVVFGTYYTRFSIKKGTFESLNFPNEKHNPDIIDWFRETPNQDWPRMTAFDDILKGLVSWTDVADWNTQCTMGMRLHNFYVFKDAIRMVTELIYGHDYILKQAVDSEVYKILGSIDEMVKSDKPNQVFERYKHLYMKMSNTKKEPTNSKHNFFKETK